MQVPGPCHQRSVDVIRTLLAPLTGDGSGIATLSAAAAVARTCHAHIDALHLRFDPAAAARAAGAPRRGIRGKAVNDLVHHLEQNARERETKALAIFTDFCTRELLPLVAEPQNADISAQWHVESDQEPRLLAVYGMNADLIVASRGTQGDDGSARFALNTLLMGSGWPVLITWRPGCSIKPQRTNCYSLETHAAGSTSCGLCYAVHFSRQGSRGADHRRAAGGNS